MVSKNIFCFNHIDEKLSQKQISELKALYKYYHRLYTCYRWKYKRLRRLKLTLELSSLGLTTIGSIAGVVTLNPIILGTIAGSGIMVQAYLVKSDLNKRVDRSRFAYVSYEKILVQLKSFLRGLPYDENIFLSDIKIIDDIVIDQCPSIDKYFDKYNNTFIQQ